MVSLIYLVSSHEKLPCLLRIYVNLTQLMLDYSNLSVINFCVLLSKYLMMVCILGLAILVALKMQR